ncbi:MAG: hypothetical protein PHD88_02035 [Firmicutes bacterium]|nr:hypothetical protein [Bacillota bacterium]MDD4262956.1 hypothetical protein [Bacillota bacterium]MDD4693171.1 hypothetical protein [Bacillota bacterium]
MRVKKLLLLMIVLLLFSTLTHAEVVGKSYRQEVWQVVINRLVEIPDYVRILQYSDLSRMEFAVVLGRLLEEHPGLNIHLQRSIQTVSWELGKLGYTF